MVRVSGKTDEEELLKLLGSAIRARRRALHMSQEALADAAQMDRAHMGKVERGERNLTLLSFARIARAVGCRASELLIDGGL